MAGGAQHRTPSTESPSPSFDDDSHGERQGLQNLDFGAHTSVRPKLYISHGLSAWNSRSFEFGAVLFLSAMYPSTLLPASIYAMTRNLAAVLFSSQVGHMVDRLPRLQVIRVSIVGQRCSVVLSCLLFYLLLSLESRASIPAWLLVGLLAFLSTVEKLSFVLNTISVERDWIVVIAGDSLDDLRSINSMMRRIDLASKLIAPLLIAFGHSFSPLAGIAIALWTALVSLPFEYLLIARVYRSCPALHHKHMGAAEPRSPSRTSDSAMLQPFTSASVDITYYCRHPAFLPSFSLSLLYLTVLSFGGQMISYLVSQGLPSWSIGLLRTAAAIFELSATWLAPHLMKSIGAVRSGIWLLNAQLSCLLLATLAVWFGTSPAILLAVFLPAVVASRAGLWGFDLSTQFLIQESVEAESRGRFSSIETAFQNVFELLAFATTVAFSDPAQFKIPCSISASATGLAAVVYAVYVRARRGHLFHASRCLDRKERAGSYQKVDQDEEDIST